MLLGSLFSGYGGLDQAVAAATGAPPVDILTGGFPCQDLSVAGARAGLSGARSGLWHEMHRAIDTMKPKLAIIENVRGILSARAHSDLEHCPWCLGDDDAEPALRALGAVLGSLAHIGYDARWHGLRAADVGAPHSRYRIFIAAWPSGAAPDAHSHPLRHQSVGQLGGSGPTRTAHDQPSAAHPGGGRRAQGSDPAPPSRLRDRSSDRDLTGTWGDYAPAIARWERVTGHRAPAPTGDDGRLSPKLTEWLMGLNPGWVTDVPGITRAEKLHILGNGVVPQQAYAALKTMLGNQQWQA